MTPRKLVQQRSRRKPFVPREVREGRQLFQVRFDTDVLDRCRELAKQRRTTVSEYIRQVLLDHVTQKRAAG